jgi:hypothetical protein
VGHVVARAHGRGRVEDVHMAVPARSLGVEQEPCRFIHG